MTSRLLLLKRSCAKPAVVLRSYTTDPFPFTNSMIRKNYLQYPKQSREEVTHDYVYSEQERLPDLKTRLKGKLTILTLRPDRTVSSYGLERVRNCTDLQRNRTVPYLYQTVPYRYRTVL